jgi:hypothetical protein
VLLDQSPLVGRRLGFAALPLSVLVIRIMAQAIGMLTTSSHHTDASSSPTLGSPSTWPWSLIRWSAGLGVGLCAWGCLVAFKVMLGLGLLSFAAVRRNGMEEREREDEVNDFGRPAVGESKEESVSRTDWHVVRLY